jgi:hypothetical protein
VHLAHIAVRIFSRIPFYPEEASEYGVDQKTFQTVAGPGQAEETQAYRLSIWLETLQEGLDLQ